MCSLHSSRLVTTDLQVSAQIFCRNFFICGISCRFCTFIFQNISRHPVLRFVFDYIRTWKIRRRWGPTLIHDDQSTLEIRGPFRPKLDTAATSDYTKLPSSLCSLMPGIGPNAPPQMPAHTVTPGTLSSSSNIRRGILITPVNTFLSIYPSVCLERCDMCP